MLRSLIASSLLLVATFLAAQSSSERAAVRVTATVQNTPAITLSWAPISSTTALTIYRKPKSATSWGSAVATPAATSTSWTDNNVSTGSNYEYKVVRVSAGVTGTGYINTGVQVPVVDYRGKIILLVDNTLSSALATELSQLTNDLRADGWGVLRSDVSRTASVTSVKSIVQGHYNSDPSNVKALYIVGHVPVPYSGNITPDGHEDTRGARPTDAYYADMDGSWTDNSVNTTATSQQRTWNTPGDGKFDQSDLPSSVELQVGRVDMYDLPAFGTTEVQLMRNYLNKAHSYKVKGWVPNARAVLVDNLQWLGNPVAGSGWRASAMVGQLSPVPTAPVLSFKNYINGQSYLWTAHYGGGLIAVDGGVSTYNGTDGGVTTQELASSVTMGGVFNMALGSFFYDFDSRNNFLRAVIARGDGLTNCWAGIPAWYFHHMGLGENIGYSVAASMNNTGLYPPLTEGWQSSIGRTHMNLMGDPSLRMKMVAPPSNLVVANAGGNAAFSWTASSEGAMGYHIYHVDVNAGVTTRLTTNPVTTTSWTSGTVPFVAGRQYMVRAMMLEIGASGSYYNLSLGAMAVSTGSGTADCLGVVGGTATVGSACNDNDPCTVNDVYNANCQCVGTSITPAASITAAGPTTFCSGGSVVLNANAGTGYSYVWRRDGATISGATSSSLTATQSGSYTVQVGSGSCTTTSTAVTVSASGGMAPTATAQGPTSFCSGGSVVITTAAASGNSYQWRLNGNTINGATGNSYTAIQSGSYTVTVSNGSCSGTSDPVVVSASGSMSTPVINAQGPISFCSGANVILTTQQASGNSYQWYLDGSVIPGATSYAYTAFWNGAHTVVVSNGTCSATSAALSISVGSQPSNSINAGGTTTFCSGGSVVLSGNTSSGYTYSWARNGTTISGATTSSYTATQSGTYIRTVSNNGCSNTSNSVVVTVTGNLTPSITALGSTSFCTGGSVVLSTASATGNSYVWQRNGTAISGATSSSYTATQAGSYTVVVANGPCSGTSSAVSVTVSGSGTTPTITAQGSTSFCSGGNVILVTQQASGNTYQWRLNGNPINGATNYAYTAFWNGNMTVTVSNGSCTVTSAPVAIQVGTAPAATITASGATSFCSGGSVVLSGNTGNGYTYSWQRNGSTISGASASSYTATTAGNYTRTVTNNGCSATSSPITVSVGSGPSPAITAQGSTSFCSGGNVLLSTASASGNNYVWQRNGTTIAGATSNTYTATMSGNYTVSVTNGNCSGTSAPVAVNASGSGPTPTVNALGPTSFCTGGNVILTTEQIAGATYQWRYNGVVLPGATNHAYTAYLNGAFTVTVTTGTCSATSAQTNINVVPGPTATISADGPTTFCAGSSVTLSTNSGTGYAYTWYRNGVVIPGATANEHTATLTGYYMVRISLSNCTSTSPSLYVQSFSPPSVTCSADPEDAAVNAVANGGLAPYAFNWNTSPTSTTAQANVTASGTYTVVVTDARGCTASCSTTIELPEGNDCMGARTETQVTWGANPSWNNPAGFMINNFAGAFPAPNHLTIGCGSRKLRLTSGSAVVAFLPSNGPIARLPSGTMVNPTSYGNTFAGQLVALKLSVRFDEYDAWYSPSTTPLGDMVVASGLFAGWTVQQVIDAADEKIGNCGNSYTREALNEALTAINEGYAGGIVNSGYLICPEGSGMAPEPAGSINAIAGTAKSIHLVDPSAVVFPNPTSGVTVFSFTPSLPDQRTTFELRSVNGALIESRDLGILPAGVEHRLDWDATGRGAGLYLYRITAGTVVMTGKLVVE